MSLNFKLSAVQVGYNQGDAIRPKKSRQDGCNLTPTVASIQSLALSDFFVFLSTWVVTISRQKWAKDFLFKLAAHKFHDTKDPSSYCLLLPWLFALQIEQLM